MTPIYQLASEAKEPIVKRLAELLAQREEILFACLHGSFEESIDGFNDIDVAVLLEPSKIQPETVFDYQMELGIFLERHVNYSIDLKVLNFAGIGFQYAASGGRLLTADDPENWFSFRERTWLTYLDFAPVARQALLDLFSATTPS
jgi:predicted nucleotidyltransferase